MSQAYENLMENTVCVKEQNLKPKMESNKKKWMAFTEKLRKLIREYPDLPVVVGADSESLFDGDCNCSISDCYDAFSNEPLARMILIHKRDWVKGEMPEI